MTPQRELMSRCRWMVEHRAQRVTGGRMLSSVYEDQVIRVTWERLAPEVPYGPDWTMPHMTVEDKTSGLVIGSYYGASGGSSAHTGRAQEIVDHLRSIMVLDDFARAV